MWGRKKKSPKVEVEEIQEIVEDQDEITGEIIVYNLADIPFGKFI